MINSYCKIFVNGPNDLGEIFGQIEKYLNILEFQELNNKSYNIETNYLYISIDKNSDFSPSNIADPIDGFLYYPFIIEVNPIDFKETYENFHDAELYLKNVLHLVSHMRKKGYELVPACDFEDYLNSEPIFSQPRP